jgi:uncharacterized membrane protein (DUF106 family)
MIEFLQLVMFSHRLSRPSHSLLSHHLGNLGSPFGSLCSDLSTGVIAALVSGLGILLGILRSPAVLVIVAASIAIGAFFSLLASSETISEKKKDELVRKNDDQW